MYTEYVNLELILYMFNNNVLYKELTIVLAYSDAFDLTQVEMLVTHFPRYCVLVDDVILSVVLECSNISFIP